MNEKRKKKKKKKKKKKHSATAINSDLDTHTQAKTSNRTSLIVLLTQCYSLNNYDHV